MKSIFYTYYEKTFLTGTWAYRWALFEQIKMRLTFEWLRAIWPKVIYWIFNLQFFCVIWQLSWTSPNLFLLLILLILWWLCNGDILKNLQYVFWAPCLNARSIQNHVNRWSSWNLKCGSDKSLIDKPKTNHVDWNCFI